MLVRQLYLYSSSSACTFEVRGSTFGLDAAVDDRGLELVSVGAQCWVSGLQLAVAQAMGIITFEIIAKMNRVDGMLGILARL